MYGVAVHESSADLIVIDDFGLTPLADETVRNLLEILDDRYDRRSTLITSQLPVEQWHAYLGDRTLADAILDRLVHNRYRLLLKGESMRKRRAAAQSRESKLLRVDASAESHSITPRRSLLESPAPQSRIGVYTWVKIRCKSLGRAGQN